MLKLSLTGEKSKINVYAMVILLWARNDNIHTYM